ncbi:MAG: hypothetical protein IJY47_03170 [Clostridia bacterium]|nr:hypothetical protein [Clostridia bacterium]
MKRIGFVDFYLGEWHADHYPQWLAQACERLELSYKVAYAWAEQELSPVNGVSTEEWCRTYGVEACHSLEELCEKSDVILILAPTNPEKHLGYAETVLRYGKPTYIDKTFAPDFKTAKAIFRLGREYDTPFFSTSALRYASELDGYDNCRQMITTGSGANLPEYVIHQIEMIVKKLGIGAVRLRGELLGQQTFLHIAYPDDRTATMIFARSYPFTVYLSDGTGGAVRPVYREVTSSYFEILMERILRFFETGWADFDGAETLEVARIREGALLARENPGIWFDLSDLEEN